MQRVSTPTAVAQKPAYAAVGDPGYFTQGDPLQGIPATVPGQDFLNRIQEEVCNVILASGRQLDGADDEQLLHSIMDIIAAALATAWPGVAAAAATGTVNAIAATFNPTITLSDRRLVAVVATGANTIIAPTFIPNDLEAWTITKQGGQPLAVGNIPRAGFVMLLMSNLANTRWELLNPVEAAAVTTLEQFLMYS